MNSRKKVILYILLLFCCLVMFCGAAPGSDEDPLVTKSWVDLYVDTAFDQLDDQVKVLADSMPSSTISFTVGKNTATDDKGNSYTADVEVLLHQNRTILPVRLLADAIGAQMYWDNAAKKATYIKGGKTVELYINKNEITVNGTTAQVDVGATLHNSRTYVPLRVIMENFGYQVEWDNATKTAAVTVR